MAAGAIPQRQIGRVLYNESDADVSRIRWTRNSTFVLAIILASLLPGLLGLWLFGKIHWSGTSPLGFILGAILGQYGFASLAPRFIVSVPQAQVFVTLNPLLAFFGIGGDHNIVYGPGDATAFPWETRSRRSNLSLEVMTIPFQEEVPGDPVQLITSLSYQFKVNIREAAKFVGVNESTIRGGVIDLIRSRVSQHLAGMSVDIAKGQINTLNQILGTDFGVGSAAALPAQDILDFEGRYGISSVAIVISGIDLPLDVQRTRDAVDEAGQAVRSVAAMFGLDPAVLQTQLQESAQREGISLPQYIEMLDRTLAQGKAANMDIRAFKVGGVDVPAIVAAIARAIVGQQTQGGNP